MAATGVMSEATVTAATTQDGTGIPVNLALLIELRIMNTLILQQMGDTPLDITQMRADELYNVLPISGVI